MSPEEIAATFRQRSVVANQPTRSSENHIYDDLPAALAVSEDDPPWFRVPVRVSKLLHSRVLCHKQLVSRSDMKPKLSTPPCVKFSLAASRLVILRSIQFTLMEPRCAS